MKKLKLKTMSFYNFKGLRDFSVDFDEISTNICGDNATFKTTIFDGFLFCLFGKNSLGKTQFNIKTLDENNVAIPKIEHFVSMGLEVDGVLTTLKRVFKEKWVKKRGSLETEFTGHETLYYWNDVPMKSSEYTSKVNQWVDEGIFKLITNPLYFNELDWQKRRGVLINICGDVSDMEIAEGNETFLKLITGLGQKTIEEFRKELSARKKKLNDDLKVIPTRIDEVSRNTTTDRNFVQIRSDIAVTELELKGINDSISDESTLRSKAQQNYTKVQDEIFGYKSKLQQISFNEKEKLAKIDREKGIKLTELRSKVTVNNSVFNQIKRDLSSQEDLIKSYNVDLLDLRKEWNTENEKVFVFDESKGVCPTCKREVEDLESKKQQFETNFKLNKSNELKSINTKGGSLKGSLEKAEKLHDELGVLLTNCNKEINSLQKQIEAEEGKLNVPKGSVSIEFILSKNSEYNSLESKISDLEKTNDKPTFENSDLPMRRDTLSNELSNLKVELSEETAIGNAKIRVGQLEEEEKKLAQQISELEMQEFEVENFEKAKVNALETKINSKFKFAKFKLFETQINGGRIPSCETLYKGVPFPDLNNAARINIGIDIINTLTNYYEVNAPIFIDNRESVNRLIPCESQLVNLVVSKDKKLVIK
jgi:hypothetical protein